MLRHRTYSVDLDGDMTDTVCVVLYIVHCVLLYCAFLYCTSTAISINGPIVFVPPRAAVPIHLPLHLWAVLVCGPHQYKRNINKDFPFHAENSLYITANS